MAKLVILNQGLVGFACELVAEKTTIGRATDNTFRIPEISVSRHHCAILQRGGDVVVADLDSSHGTFIDGKRIREAALRTGQILKVGDVEMRLEETEMVPDSDTISIEKTHLFTKQSVEGKSRGKGK